MTQEELESRLQSYVGVREGPYLGWDQVNRAMIRHWCDAMGDGNPVYVDAALASEVYGTDNAVVAPATMLQAWTMVGYCGKHPPGSASIEVSDGLPIIDVFYEAGFNGVVATNCEQDYHQTIVEGDDIHHYSSIESVSGRKSTGLGEGYFMTQLFEYRNQREELVGEMRFRTLHYIPAAQAGQG